MAYVPNPADPTQPVESVIAQTAAAEFRALKAYIQTLAPGLSQPGRLLNVQRLAGAGNYTETVGTTSIVAFLLGGGGSGGGAVPTLAGQLSCGSGGGAGAFAIHRATTGFSGAAFSVGAGGAAANGASNPGAATTFLGVTAGGGGGGNVIGNTASAAILQGGAGGNSSGANVLSGAGAPGQSAIIFAAAAAFGAGSGASSIFGGGATAPGSGNFSGVPAIGFGSGGSGGTAVASSPIEPGGAGSAGTIIVFEYT
jgi:hypothetical protein